MDVRRFAHERWGWGARDEDEVAKAFIQAALRSHDPASWFQSAVKAAVAQEFRRQRQEIEDRVPWEALQQETGTKDRTAWGDPDHEGSTLDRINTLLKSQVWVWRTDKHGKPDGKMIPWAELTTEDLEQMISRERAIIKGHERRITRLETAKALIEKYQVRCFGDVPFTAEIMEEAAL
jgi:hypothetical protein